eukprot:871875-Pleurochrysis_carterae.AAC.1
MRVLIGKQNAPFQQLSAKVRGSIAGSSQSSSNCARAVLVNCICHQQQYRCKLSLTAHAYSCTS